jgi:signal transduction histidine kinase
MAEVKEHVASAIARAQAELAEALAKLERIPAFDAGSVAFAAHALNNYLTVSGVAIQLIMKSLADYPDPQVKIWLEGLQQSTNLMERTVRQLMFKSEPQETKFRIEEVDMPTLVQRACDYYQRLADLKKIRVNARSVVDVFPVWTDRVAIAAVLDNLLSNAVKFSSPNKQIWVQVRGQEGWVECRVQDEGPGLSQEDQAKLFQRGVQLTPRPTGDETSTGYGLAVAKEMIEKLGGQIWCESQLGQGSSFVFRLKSGAGDLDKPPSGEPAAG